MTTTDKLAEALQDSLSVCNSVSMAAGRRVVINGCVLYAQTEEWCQWAKKEVRPRLQTALNAHDAEQAQPLKERPDFMAGYVAGLADGRRCVERDAAEQAAKAVPQWRKIGYSQWWDGHPDHEDGGGPYESRTLYTHAAPTPPAPEAQQAEPVAWPSASEIADEIDALLPMSLGDATKAALEGWWLQLVARKLSKLPITHQALAQRREPLTDAEIEEILHGEIALNPGDGCAGRFARAIERAHGIGGEGKA